jgi:hypothetical protein
MILPVLAAVKPELAPPLVVLVLPVLPPAPPLPVEVLALLVPSLRVPDRSSAGVLLHALQKDGTATNNVTPARLVGKGDRLEVIRISGERVGDALYGVPASAQTKY